MRCSDMVMHAMSYHPRHRGSAVARAYWAFAAEWQTERGDLHRRGGQWYKVELASRFRFPSVRRILEQSLPLAVRRQKRHGGFRDDRPAVSACQVALAYARWGLLGLLLSELRYDLRPIIQGFDAPMGLVTRHDALGAPNPDDEHVAARQAEARRAEQSADGSWQGLIVATTAAIHDLLDCGIPAHDPALCRGCEWLLAQQRAVDRAVFPEAPHDTPGGAFYVDRVEQASAYVRAQHPEFGWQRDRHTCIDLLPTHQTGAALAALCRCGYADAPQVAGGFDYLLSIRGPGGANYEHYWCNCRAGRWLRAGVQPFESKSTSP
jgi:hypothetical protein